MKQRHWNRRGIIREFGQWCVTSWGVANLYGPCSYEIDREALANVWWSEHMADKRWVVREDFDRALAFARKRFNVRAKGGGVLW